MKIRVNLVHDPLLNYPSRKTTLKKRAQAQANYWANRAKVLAQKKALIEKDPIAFRERSKRYMKAFYDRNPGYEKRMAVKKKVRLQSEMYRHLGNRCACCGEKEIRFLSIDHIKNDGKEHREKFRGGTRILYAIKREGWPKDRYRLLCMNCNWGRGKNHGVCPHEEARLRNLEVPNSIQLVFENSGEER